MAGEKASLAGTSEQGLRSFGDGDFDAAYVGHKLIGLEDRSQLFEPFLNGEYGAAQEDQVALDCRADGVVGSLVDRAAVERDLELRRGSTYGPWSPAAR